MAFAAVWFLTGYVAKKRGKDNGKCQSNNGKNPTPNKEIYHKMFQEEMNAKKIEDNTRYVVIAFAYLGRHVVIYLWMTLGLYSGIAFYAVV